MILQQIELNTIVYVLLVHLLADFALQTTDQAINKSTSVRYLFYHVLIYSVTFGFAMYGYTSMLTLSLIFAFVTFVFHFITDYYTSKLAKTFFDKKDYHNGFIVVGFDQLLHYIQLFVTYLYLI